MILHEMLMLSLMMLGKEVHKPIHYMYIYLQRTFCIKKYFEAPFLLIGIRVLKCRTTVLKIGAPKFLNFLKL
jgi:hypothetical protein